MNRTIYLAAALLSLAATAGASDLPAGWKSVQELTIATPGLVKLSLPPATLDAARPGLEDLRLLDPAGQEVPFLVERPVATAPVVRLARSFDVALAADATVITLASGCPEPIDGVTLETAAPSFIKAVQIEGSPDGARWTVLAKGQPVFRQPYGASQLRVTIPAAVWPFLRLTVDDRRAEPVAFTGARIHAARTSAPAEPLPVTIADRTENEGQTRLTLDLGAAHLTLASLRLDSPEPLFVRSVTVALRTVTENAITERALAHGTIYRIAGGGQAASAELSLPLDVQIPSRTLLVLIDNHDSPPLPIAAVQAERRPMYVIFLARQASRYRVLTGNAHCPAPRYDLAALGASFKGLAVSPLSLTALADNPAYHPAETLPEIQDRGTALNCADWKYRKRVQLTGAGVQRLELDLELLAHADPGLGDLRLVHANTQYPYILERTSILRRLTPQLAAANDPKRPTVSRWLLKLPHAALPIVRLTAASRSPLFRRQMLLFEQPVDERGEPYRRLLAETIWVHTPAQPAPPLELVLNGAPTTAQLILETDNGDNPPLELTDCQAAYPVTRLLFKAPADHDLYLYYGNRAAGFPRYDLDLVAGQLLAADTVSATLAPEEQLQQSSWTEALAVSPARRIILWAVLAGVVVLLLVVIGRLLPKGTPP